MENNKAQDRVIGKTEGQLIVVACPGSGKTTTLLRRIDHMVHDHFYQCCCKRNAYTVRKGL